MSTDAETFRRLLRRPVDDPAVQALIRVAPDGLERVDWTGFIRLQRHGVAVMFKTAPWVTGEEGETLHVEAVHFYSPGYENSAGFAGSLPAGLTFGAEEAPIRAALGDIRNQGGGTFSRTLRRTVLRWISYDLGADILHLQFGATGGLELVTIYVPLPGA
ncbi:hypothetical protein P7L75_03085 (plasmid) [Tistrella mobilis]|uniref:hypothetical protein n=1 Tax=Tistrella mobilis TaxID=171437 RepID=UPI003555E824